MSTAARDWQLWSTSARIVVTDHRCLDVAAAFVDQELARVETACSRFRQDSELLDLVVEEDGSRLLSPLLAELVRAALDAARDTSGAVDPTLGAAMVGLGYDRDIELVRGADRPVAPVGQVPGWQTLRLVGRRLFGPPGLELDLGATAKAVAADRCAALVQRRLGVGVLISLGGDIATAGPAPIGGWQVTVQDLATDPARQVTLGAGAAVATSSTAKRTWTQGGEPRHHLLAPDTGRPVTGPWRAATVVAPTCLQANVATTAAVVKGRDAVAWLRSSGLPARLVSTDGLVTTLGGWPREQDAA
jgi:thiamine biosynthesis lipoprotein